MSWQRGRGEIERLLGGGELERVTPSDEVASRLLGNAEAHIGLASKGVEDDPAGSLQLSYDAARARFDDRGGIDVFGRLNRRRNTTEYPDADSPTVVEGEARRALATARETLDAANRLVQSGRLDPFE